MRRSGWNHQNGMKCPPLRKLVNAETSSWIISDMYRSIEGVEQGKGLDIIKKEKLEKDVGPLSQESWNCILEAGARVSISPSQIVSHLYLIHRAYYTPQRMFQFGRRPYVKCQRCWNERGVHMVWRCPKLYQYWKEIVEKINAVFEASLPPEVKTCVLGLLE